MHWVKKLWLRVTYKHPSRNIKPLTDVERTRAAALYRQSLQEDINSQRNKKKAIQIDKLTLPQIALGQQCVFDNANALIREAKWLRYRHYYARAFVLAKLAQEEFGKIYLLDSAAMLVVVDAEDYSWIPFWHSWRNHKGKSFWMKMPFTPKTGGIERIDFEESAKLRALYVEYEDSGFSLPYKSITRCMADEMIDICDLSAIHIKAKFRDHPLMDDYGKPGPRVEALLSTLLEVESILDKLENNKSR